MKKVSLNADIRDSAGKNQSHKLKRNNMIPGVLYGRENNGNTLLKIEEKEIHNLLSKNGEKVIVQLNLNGTEIPSVIKEVQRDPQDRSLVHIDFQPVTLHEIIHAELPIVVVNGERVEKNGWVLHRQVSVVEVEGEVEKIPRGIMVDARKLKLGDVLKVSDLEISQELSIVSDVNEVILSVKAFKEQPVDLVFPGTEPELVKSNPT